MIKTSSSIAFIVDSSFIHSLIHSTEVVVFIVLVLLFLTYYRGTSRKYIKFWMFSLSALSMYHCVVALQNIFNSQSIGAIADMFLAVLRQSSLYLHFLFLAFGLYTATDKPNISKKTVLISVVLTLGICLITTLLYGFDANSEISRFYLRESLAAFICGCILLISAFYLFSASIVHFTSKLFLFYCLFVGIRYVAFSLASLVFLSDEWFLHLSQYLTYTDLGINIILVFILLFWIQGAQSNTRVKAVNQAKYLSEYDSLTGLLNRENVLEKLTQEMKIAEKKTYHLDVFLLDIKHFTLVNETYGLKVGDGVLEEVARRLNQSILKPKLVGRLSGDSFIYVIEDNPERQHKDIAEHLHYLISAPYFILHQEVHLQCCVGYCQYPVDADVSDDLLQRANVALFHAENNNIRSVKYTAGMQVVGRDLLAIEKEIRHAISNEEFVLHFQPQLNLKSNRLDGAEVLVRWEHPNKGLLAPGQFFDDIEALNLFSVLDNYVLEKTCQTIARWFEIYKRRVPLAINITADEFQSPDFIGTIQDLLMKYDIPPIYIELEVTENVMIKDIDFVMHTIIILQNMGIKVSIDDFGTGYSSLGYLRKLPIDKIKIDRSFIQEVASNDSDLTIVKAMVELSHGLGKRVLAEGVETQEQLQLLKNIGCDAVQGYFISKPISEDQFTRYLKRK